MKSIIRLLTTLLILLPLFGTVEAQSITAQATFRKAENLQREVHPDAFTGLGIDPTARKIVVIKSTQHFYAGFAPIASEVIYVAAPGAIVPDFANIPFTKLDTPYWPNVADPFADGNGSEN